MPIHSSQKTASGIILPDFNAMARIHADLHTLLTEMTDNQTQSTLQDPTYRRNQFTSASGTLLFTHDISLGSSGNPDTSHLIVTDLQNRQDSLRSKTTKHDGTIFLTYEPTEWPAIETEIKRYLQQRSRQKTLGQTQARTVPLFNQIATTHNQLHDHVKDMVLTMGNNRHSDLYGRVDEYASPQTALAYTYDIQTGFDERVNIKNTKTGADFVSYYQMHGLRMLAFSPSIWPEMAADLKVAIPQIQTSRALSRRFP